MMKYKSVYCIKQNTKEVLCALEGFWGRSIERVPEIEYTNLFSR